MISLEVRNLYFVYGVRIRDRIAGSLEELLPTSGSQFGLVVGQLVFVIPGVWSTL